MTLIKLMSRSTDIYNSRSGVTLNTPGDTIDIETGDLIRIKHAPPSQWNLNWMLIRAKNEEGVIEDATRVNYKIPNETDSYIVVNNSWTTSRSTNWIPWPALPHNKPGYTWEIVIAWNSGSSKTHTYRTPRRKDVPLNIPDWENTWVDSLMYSGTDSNTFPNSWRAVRETTTITNLSELDSLKLTAQGDMVFTEDSGLYGPDNEVYSFLSEDRKEIILTLDAREVTELKAHVEIPEPKVTTEEESYTEDVPYETEYVDDPEELEGTETVIQEGIVGIRTIIEEVTYTDGVETDRTVISNTITTQAVNKIISVGTRIPVITQETEVREEISPKLPTTYQDNETAPEGVSRVLIEGNEGLIEITELVTYTDGIEISRTETGRTTITEATGDLVERGTFNLQDRNISTTISNLSPAPGDSNANVSQDIGIAFRYGMKFDSINEDNIFITLDGARVVLAEFYYDSLDRVLHLDPNQNLRPGTIYKVTLKGGPGGVARIGQEPQADDTYYYFMTEGEYEWEPSVIEWIPETTEVIIPFTTEYVYDPNLSEGEELETQAGIDGIDEITIEYEYLDGSKTGQSREVGRTTITQMVPRVVNTSYDSSRPIAYEIVIVGDSKSKIRRNNESRVYKQGETMTLRKDDFINVEANAGYAISNQSYMGDNRDSELKIWLYLQENDTKGRLDITGELIYNEPNLNLLRIITEPRVTGHANYNNLYLVDGEALKEVNTTRFIVEDVHVLIADYGQYIINLLELPMPINDDILLPKTSIRLANYNVPNTNVPLINGEKMYLDIGNITIPNKYNNLIDFNQTTVIIHLPFAHSIQIENKYAIGQTVSIEYVIDLYTGETTANFRTTKLDNKLFHSEKFILGKSIPMTSAFDPSRTATVMTGLSNVSAGIHNNIFTAYAEVSRHVPDQVDNIYNVNIVANTTLDNETGYLIVSNIKLETQATYIERDMILNILSSGIHIR